MFCYSVTKMENNFEERCAIKFCVKLREGATDTYEKIQKASGNDSVLLAEELRWYKDLVNGEKRWKMTRDLNVPPASVGTSTNFDRVRAFIRQDRHLTDRIIADEHNE
jgi:hypothetical protein